MTVLFFGQFQKNIVDIFRQIGLKVEKRSYYSKLISDSNLTYDAIYLKGQLKMIFQIEQKKKGNLTYKIKGHVNGNNAVVVCHLLIKMTVNLQK